MVFHSVSGPLFLLTSLDTDNAVAHGVRLRDYIVHWFLIAGDILDYESCHCVSLLFNPEILGAKEKGSNATFRPARTFPMRMI